MSRSGYGEGDSDSNFCYLWESIVKRSINGRRGQAFLRELAKAMDEMPVKRLILDDLVTPAGECCTIGVVCKARGVDTSEVDVGDRDEVGGLVGISGVMAAEIEYYNDEVGPPDETPEQRWVRMRHWVGQRMKEQA